MKLDQSKLAAVAETAKSKTNDRRWVTAIDRAVEGLTGGKWVVTELTYSVAITTESGQTYFANGVCQCRAYRNGQPCKHRAAARLVEIYNETHRDTRASLIAEIKSIWPKTWPPLATELMARFGKNKLEMLDDDSLRRVRLAVAM